MQPNIQPVLQCTKYGALAYFHLEMKSASSFAFALRESGRIRSCNFTVRDVAGCSDSISIDTL